MNCLLLVLSQLTDNMRFSIYYHELRISQLMMKHDDLITNDVILIYTQVSDN